MGRFNPVSSKEKRDKLVLLAFIGFAGLTAEVVGLGFLFAWWNEVPRSLTDPRLFIGAVLAFIGFILLVRGLSYVIKQLILMLSAQPQ